jgi:hypothetical protein
MLFGSESQEDGSVAPFRYIVVRLQEVLLASLFLGLGMLLHVLDERCGRALDLGGIELVRRAIRDFGCERCLGGLLCLLYGGFPLRNGL